MPYNPSTGIYTLPAIYLAVPGTTIIAAQHNVPLVDLQTANNYARPIEAGGTNAATAAGARAELEVPGLAVVNTFTATNSWSRGADIVSATSLILGTDGNYFHVTGANSIAEISPISGAGPVYLEFDGVLTLLHDPAALILPGGLNIVTAAGDTAIFLFESTLWRCINYQPASSSPAIGTWTPSLRFAVNGNLSAVFDIQSGTYVRLGSLIIANFVLRTTTFTHTTSTGSLSITGLPFTVGSAIWQGPASVAGVTKAGYTNFTWQPTGATTQAVLAASGSGVVLDTVDATNMPTGGTVQLRGTLIYTV